MPFWALPYICVAKSSVKSGWTDAAQYLLRCFSDLLPVVFSALHKNMTCLQEYVLIHEKKVSLVFFGCFLAHFTKVVLKRDVNRTVTSVYRCTFYVYISHVFTRCCRCMVFGQKKGLHSLATQWDRIWLFALAEKLGNVAWPVDRTVWLL